MAEAILKSSPILELTTKQASRLADRPITPPRGRKPFLVRALYLNAHNGRYDVYESQSRLWVVHTSLGARSYPMRHSALVVILDGRPANVYVTASMGE